MHLSSVLILTLFLPPGLGSPALAQDGPEDAVLVTRRYEFPMPMRVEEVFMPVGELLLRPPGDDIFEHGDSESRSAEPEQIIDLIRTIIDPEEWEYEGRRLELAGRGLLVHAPAALHQKVAAFLAYLEAQFTASTRINIEIYPVTAGKQVPMRASGLHTSDAADRLVRDLMAGGVLGTPRTLRANAMPLGTAIGGGFREYQFLADWDVEIAQGSAIADPVIRKIHTGSFVQARTARAYKGTALQLVMRHGDLLEPLRRDNLGIWRELNGEMKSVDSQLLVHTIQKPRVASTLWATTTFLPDGQDMIMVGNGGGPWGPYHFLVRLRVQYRDAQLPPMTRAGEISFALRDLSLLGAPAVSASGFISFSSMRASLPDGNYSEGKRFHSFTLGDEFHIDSIIEGIRSVLPEPGEDDRVEVMGGAMVVSGEEAHVRRVLRALEDAYQDLASPHVFDLEVTDRSGQASYLRATLPVSEAATGWAAVGSQANYVMDFDVEVAQMSDISDPVVAPIPHGLIARLDARSRADGKVRLGLQAAINLVEGELKKLEIPAWNGGTIEIPQSMHAFVQESLVLERGEEVVIGDLDPAGAKGMRLVVRYR